MPGRKALGPKLRFQVFKRDDFTCRYCGRKTPSVVLEIDHVIPVVEGGADELENLITSCWECNRGKGAGLLTDRAPVTDVHDQTVLILERELQLREYNEVRRQQREREENDINELLAFWDDLNNRTTYKYPQVHTLRRWLKIFSLEDIREALEIAHAKAGQYNGVKYYAGILRNWAKQRGIELADEAE